MFDLKKCFGRFSYLWLFLLLLSALDEKCLPKAPTDKHIKAVENLGEILTGDLIENSPYEIKMSEAE